MSLTVEQVAPDVQRLRMQSWRGRAVGYEVSAYLLRGVLVDSGFPGARAEFLEALRALAPRGAVITHWHEDHAGNAPALAAEGVPTLMHAACEATLRERPPIRFYRRAVWGRTSGLEAPVTAFDAAPLQVIATPGHSDDHLVVWDAERRIVAAGDLFLGVKVRVAHAHESPGSLLESLRTVAALEPLLLLDGHRGVVENATAMLRAKIGFLEEVLGQITSLAQQGAAEGEIQRRVLGREAFIGVASFGEYSKRAFVTAVLREAR